MRTSTYDQLISMIMEINGGGVIFKDEDEDSASKFNRVGRRKGEVGLREGDQRILSCTVTNKECRAIMLEITYLAAGFIVGYKGDSIKQIWTKTGASIRSTLVENKEERSGESTTRLFHISGSCYQILKTLKIFQAAVNRYKDLVDGQKTNQVVDSKQLIEGIIFQYCPPPIDVSPYAARTMKFPAGATKQTRHRQQQAATPPPQEPPQSPTHPSSLNCMEDQSMKSQMMRYGTPRTETPSPPYSFPSSEYGSPSQSFFSSDQHVSPPFFAPTRTPSTTSLENPNFEMPLHTTTTSQPQIYYDSTQQPCDYNYYERQGFQSHPHIGYSQNQSQYQYQQYFQPYEHQMHGYGVLAYNYGLQYGQALYPVSQSGSHVMSPPYYVAM